MRRFVIIGDGAAGTAAVETLRQEEPNASITLLSADPNPCYYRAALTNYLIGELRDGEIWAVPPDFYDRYDIERRFCRATQVDTRASVVITDDGARIPYDALLIASGAQARRVRVPGDEVQGVRLFRTLQDVNGILNDLPHMKQALIAGGGILGLEWVHGMHLRGIHPIFMMRQDVFWPQVLDRTASDIVLSRMRREGVEVRLQEEVAEVLSRDGRRISGVRTKAGEQISCQLYGQAFGIVPNVAFLEGSGIDYDNRGVKVDGYMKTNVPDVYAAGDVIQYQDPSLPFPNPGGLWQPSRQQAQVAVRNMLGMNEKFQPGALYNATRLWDLNVGSLGVTVPETGKGYEEIIFFPEPRIYKKLVLKEGKVHGALLLGDRREGRAIKRLMDKQLNVSSIKDNMFDPSFDLKGWIQQNEGQGVEQRRYAATVLGGSAPSILTQGQARAKAPSAASGRTVISAMLGDGAPAVVAPASLRFDAEYPLEAGTNTIGRAPDSDVVIAQPTVSGRHATITMQGDSYFLADSRSSNGTFLNGERLVAPRVLSDGDEIRFGDVVGRFRGPANMRAAPQGAGSTSGYFTGPAYSYPLQAALVRIGRGAENEIVLDDNEVSRLHAQVSQQSADGALYLLDMGSENGTFVNDQRMTNPRRLQSGDEVRIGQTLLRFVAQLPAGAPPLRDLRQSASPDAPFLVVREGPNRGQREPIQGALRIGRGEDCDIVLSDRRVSRHHTEILWQENRAFVRDLGSANGTWLGTTRLWSQQAVPVPPDAEIRMGSTVLRIEFGGQVVRPKEVEVVRGETVIGTRKLRTAAPLWLTFRDAGGQRPVPLGDDPLILGRDLSSDVRLTDAAASRRHVRVERRPDGVYVSDLESANGTFVNDVRIGRSFIPLRPGDVMRIGKTTIRVTDVPPANAPDAQEPEIAPAFWLSFSGEEAPPPMPIGARPVELGRDETCDVILTDDQASRRHARLEVQKGRLTVRDLRSINGTFLNEKRIGREPVKAVPGDRLRIGSTLMSLSDNKPSSLQAQPAGTPHIEERAGIFPAEPAREAATPEDESLAKPVPAEQDVTNSEPVPLKTEESRADPLPHAVEEPPTPDVTPTPLPLWLSFGEQGAPVPVPIGSEPLHIGRLAGCEIVLADAKASRRHARLERWGDEVFVTDLGSANGTYLNDERLGSESRRIAPGDVLRIGTTFMRLEVMPPAP